jgi:hypothetical protein
MLFADRIRRLRDGKRMLRGQFAAIGLRISAVANVSMVDVCRIVPFSEGYDDTENGLNIFMENILNA